MSAPTAVNFFDLINFCLEQHPEWLGIYSLNDRIRNVRTPRKPAPSGACFHKPSGEFDLVGTIECACGETHARSERCYGCGELIPYHGFPGREPRITLLTVEMPENVGENLRGPEEERAFLVAFSIDSAAYDEFVRRSASPIILPAGKMS